MQYDRYATGPDNRSTSIVTGIKKLFHYFETDIVCSNQDIKYDDVGIFCKDLEGNYRVLNIYRIDVSGVLSEY